MYILLGVRMSVVAAMMCCPPQWSSLARATGNKSTEELD